MTALRDRWTRLLLAGVSVFGFDHDSSSAYDQHQHHETPAEKSVKSDGDHEAKVRITLSDLENLDLKHNPSLAQAAQIVEGSRGKSLQAGLYPNPTIGYAGEQIGVRGTAGEFQGGFVEQTIVTAHKLRLSRA